jgi:hypothetical protein
VGKYPLIIGGFRAFRGLCKASKTAPPIP